MLNKVMHSIVNVYNIIKLLVLQFITSNISLYAHMKNTICSNRHCPCNYVFDFVYTMYKLTSTLDVPRFNYL